MPGFLLLMLADLPGSGLTTYQALTRAGPHCNQPSGDEVTVCGRRAADRYRVPLIERDPEKDVVPLERERLLARTTNCQEKRLFLTGCGMVGATVSTAGGLRAGGERPIAP
ncbi:hypothetical protein [Sphingomonas immobilis]|uniref:Uncharacterized protein n=1 Tax=Sphingomonas immobilis TaxID=3063997 RepID=A0ABT9A087_9SPHN|nr:hypothetical protein [Sphingomonas sp. CA1-15]MDO7843234.1 hypothetical protein [Sphingomonas sp. CA1-15]